MKVIIILLLFALSLCDNEDNTTIPALRMPSLGPATSLPPRLSSPSSISPFIKCSSNGLKKGLCSKKIFRGLINKNQFKSKYSNNCEKCEKRGNCPLACRKFVKNVQKKPIAL